MRRREEGGRWRGWRKGGGGIEGWGFWAGGEIGGVLGGGERGERGEGGYEAYEITHGGIDGMRITKRGGWLVCITGVKMGWETFSW